VTWTLNDEIASSSSQLVECWNWLHEYLDKRFTSDRQMQQ